MGCRKGLEDVNTKDSAILAAFHMDWEDVRNHQVFDFGVC
jgi:hypothetical protein